MPVYKREIRFPALTVSNKLPANLSGADLYLFQNDLIRHLPEVALNFISDVQVTPHGILFEGFRIFDRFLIWKEHKQEFSLSYLLRNKLRRNKLKTDPQKKYLVCFDYWSMGYFHWMCDFLPRLVAAGSYLSEYTLVLPYNHAHAFVEGSLKAFGIKNILRFSDNEYLSLKEALVPDYVSRSGDNNPEVMKLIRQKFWAYYQPVQDPETYSANVYVSRSRAKGRFITNEQEVVKALEALGFRTVYFEEHSLEEQIAIAFNCKNLIGLHGANLTNLMFMNSGANVLELRKEGDTLNNYYYSLASSFDLNYFYLQCRGSETTSAQTFNLNVDLDALLEVVRKMIRL